MKSNNGLMTDLCNRVADLQFFNVTLLLYTVKFKFFFSPSRLVIWKRNEEIRARSSRFSTSSPPFSSLLKILVITYLLGHIGCTDRRRNGPREILASLWIPWKVKTGEELIVRVECNDCQTQWNFIDCIDASDHEDKRLRMYPAVQQFWLIIQITIFNITLTWL